LGKKKEKNKKSLEKRKNKNEIQKEKIHRSNLKIVFE